MSYSLRCRCIQPNSRIHNSIGNSRLSPSNSTASPVPGQTSKMQRRFDSVGQLLDAAGITHILLDQFGVLHDGKVPYPHAAAAVQRLAAAGAQVYILSNSSRRSAGTIGKLERMGFQPGWFAGAITSGELTHRYLSTRPTPWWQALGRRCIHMTWSSRGSISLEGLGLELVTDPSKADFILAHGTEAIGLPLPDGSSTRDMSLAQLEALISQCAEVARQQGREIPMVVANPDLVTVDGANGLITMPGTLAKQYSQLGGTVQLMGKPDPLIYTAAREMLQQQQQEGGDNQQQQRWLAIGDSLEHDIAGGAAAGMETLFIAGGIHAADVQLVGEAADANSACSWDEAALAELCGQHGGVQPTYCMPFLQP